MRPRPFPQDSGNGCATCKGKLVIVMIFFLSCSGVLPQVFGGYPAQLNLNNSGQYYNLYYTHPQEITAIEWLQDNVANSPFGTGRPEVEMDTYTFSRVSLYTNITLSNDIFPALLQRNAYVFLGYSNVTTDQATISYNGDIITYKYPIGLLNAEKDLIYSSNGAAIYR